MKLPGDQGTRDGKERGSGSQGQGCWEQVEEGRILQDPKSFCRVRQGGRWEARGETQALSRNLDVTRVYSEGSGEQATGSQKDQEVSTRQGLGNEGQERHPDLVYPSSPCLPQFVSLHCVENKDPMSTEGRGFLD